MMVERVGAASSDTVPDSRQTEGFLRLRRWLIGFFVSALALLISAYAVVVWLGPRYAIAEKGREVQTLSLALSEQVEATLRSEAAILTSLQREIRARGGVEALTETAWFEMFNSHLALFGDSPADKPLHALFYVDINGIAAATSVSNPTKQVDASAREYFAFHRDRPGDEHFITEITRSKVTGLWVFYLTQRISAADGSFRGGIGISLRFERFEDLFERLRLPADSSIAIHRSDGMPLFRHPFTEAFANFRPEEQPAFQRMVQRQVTSRNGYELLVSPFDQSRRITGFNVGRQFPILALVSVTEDSALDDWRRTIFWLGGLGAVAISLSIGLFLFIELNRYRGNLLRAASSSQ
jgi:hypothetical protein